MNIFNPPLWKKRVERYHNRLIFASARDDGRGFLEAVIYEVEIV